MAVPGGGVLGLEFVDAGKPPRDDSQLWKASPSCRRLFVQLVRLAASRTFCTAGNRSETRTPMMAITTSSSIKVKARRWVRAHMRYAPSEPGHPLIHPDSKAISSLLCVLCVSVVP